ncbi:Rieske (2Fe-2S) protein [Natronosalvus vescus]|uniref:Rieske (2Fe-2S) protein n=1 Tax=Natronosalvus vescus TaxID=2953881 RepID=UPI002091E0B1|nr:Rieske 2Fe-2S domain-containing protein [Natronosalvus vescus]
MTTNTELTSVETVHEDGSWLFTVRDQFGTPEEVILVPCDTGSGVEAWVNRCMHEPQRLDRGFGAAIRNGNIVCPRHGSMFDACSGKCDNGKAKGTRLVSIDVTVEDGTVFLTDSSHVFAHEGGIDGVDDEDDGDGDDDSGPTSTSHISF